MVKFKGISKDSNTTLNFLIGFLFFLGFIFTVIPPLREALSVFLFLSIISFIVYRSVAYQGDLFGFSRNNLASSIFFGIFAGIGFYVLGRFIPGFSIGYPALPGAVSDTAKFIVIVFIAPWIETIAIQGALFGYLKYMFRKSKYGFVYALIGQALFFALLHLGAYIYGFYRLPEVAVLGAISGNLRAFLFPFIFAIVSGIIVSLNGIKNLIFVGFMHMTINLFIYTSLTVVFVVLTLIKLIVSIL